MRRANRASALLRSGALCAALLLCGTAAGADVEAEAKRILDATGVTGGLVVHVGCGDGKLTAALRASDSFLVHGLDTDAAKVDQARKHIGRRGLYGRASVDRCRGGRLPYVDNLVRLLVGEQLGGVETAEVMRVLAPDGVAYVKADGQWRKTVKPRPKNIDEWTHYLHDAGGNAVAHDSVVGPPRRLQWVGSPRWSRHHDHMSSVSAAVSAGGRVFYIFDEGLPASIQLPSKWKLIARDAFNGVILWKRPIDKWHTRLWPLKSGPAQLPRRLVAVGDRVYAALGLDAPLTALDAATGRTVRTYKDTKHTEELIASDGVLYVLVNPAGDAEGFPGRDYATVAETRRGASTWTWQAPRRQLLAIRADSGKRLWTKRQPVVPLTLAADAKRVFFHDGQKVVVLNRSDAGQAWASQPIARAEKIRSNFAPTLVVHDGVVVFAGGEKYIPHRGGKDTMTAMDAETGRVLWTADHAASGYQSPEDVLIAGGLVWTGATSNTGYDGVFRGHDLRTGEVKSQFPPDVQTYWFHHRCYRAKATDKFLLMSRTGIEFLDLAKRSWMIHHWIRGACLYGIMPCNGLIYAPQHPCACYPEAKLNGFNAVAPALTDKPPTPKGKRLERGPAYGAENPPFDEARGRQSDWPTYRHDAARSGRSGEAVPADVKQLWQIELGGRLSPAVIAGGRLFVAAVDRHSVHALDAGSGRLGWSYTAGGRVDSPPTVHRGRVLFGSADGCVYCLRATDGELMWRFRAAPADRRLTAFEQVESVWPVHGNVLVVDDASGKCADGIACFTAGRSMFLDGGLRLCRLDVNTGRLISETVMDGRDPETGKDVQERIQVLNMPVALPDILSSDGKRIYMRSQVFDLAGRRQDLGPHSGDPARQGSVQRGQTAHLFAPSGFLDDTWFHRQYWVYGRSFAGGHAGYYQAGKFAPSGRILCFDDSRVYAFGRKQRYYRWTTPLEYHLFAADKMPPPPPQFSPAARRGKKPAGSMIRVEITESQNPAGKPLAVEAWVKADKPNGVVLARGGPSHGYALILSKGRPRFVVRVDSNVHAAGAKQNVVGKWVHLAGVLTPDKKLLIYVDGKLAAEGKTPGFIVSDPAQPMEIGADEAGAVGDYASPFALAATIDEVRVFHGTVTAEEIAQHAAGGKPAVKDAKLVCCYSFDKGDAKDESGNKNHGVVAAVKPAKGKVGGAMRFTGKAAASGSRGGRGTMKFQWSQQIPLLARAMVLTGKTLFVAGPRDLIDEDQTQNAAQDPDVLKKLAAQSDALEGKQGALLRAVSVDEGTKLAEMELPDAPVFDGLAAAGGRLFMVTTDGKIVCLGGK